LLFSILSGFVASLIDQHSGADIALCNTKESPMACALLIVLDGLGVGNAPDAASYGDAGSNTLGNMASVVGGVNIPNLQSLGLGNIQEILGTRPVESARAGYGRLQEVSAGKDSTTGHWELMGLVTETPFPTYPKGFPDEVLDEFTRLTGYGVLGNKAASGTAIIEELGDEHLASGKLIVYTSADSVFQIAAHDQVCDLEELYRVCEIAREMLVGEHRVSRVIARPFTGPSGQFNRTEFRHDYSVEPPEGSLVLTALQKHGVRVVSIGKIYDLFAGTGIDESHVSRNNAEGMAELDRQYAGVTETPTLILLNLVDFDMLWGHRNDPQGMKEGLESFDEWLGTFLPKMTEGDLLLMTADHGNDPTTPSTDHSREHVPIIAYLAGSEKSVDLGVRQGFMDVAATYAEFFGAPALRKGTGFLSSLKMEDVV
jgi:phosphopentomutase